MKKSKLFLSLLSMCFALAVLCFGVYAANQVNYSISGNITYTVEDCYVYVTTSVYKSTRYMSRLDVRNKIDDASEDITEITSDEDFVLLSNLSDSFDTVDADPLNPYEFPDELELSFSTQQGSEAYAYFFVINVKKMTHDVKNCWVAIDDEISEADNTYIYDNMFVNVTEEVNGSNLIVALALDDQTASIDDESQDFAFGIRMETGDDIALSEWNLSKIDFEYDSENDKYAVKGKKEDDEYVEELKGLVVIPSSYNNKTVDTIAEDGFSGNYTIREVYLQTSIQNLGISAFYASYELNNINLQNFSGDTIPDDNFVTTKLVKVIIPESVTNIGAECFWNEEPEMERNYFAYIKLPSNLEYLDSASIRGYGDALECIEIDEVENQKYYVSGHFLIESDEDDVIVVRGFGLKSITSITIPSNVTIIEGMSFEGCESLNSVIISEGVKKIEGYAFSQCINLNYVSLPNSLIKIGNGVFYNTPLVEDIDYDENGFKIIDGKCLYSADRTKNFGNISVQNLSGIKVIAGGAFDYCTNLVSIELPADIKVISSYTFNDCSNLQSVSIPNGLKEISGYYAFGSCPQLSNLVIPSTVTYVDSSAFSHSLSKIYLYNTTGWNSAWKDQCSATVYTYSENQPGGAGNYWHYVNDVVTEW